MMRYALMIGLLVSMGAWAHECEPPAEPDTGFVSVIHSGPGTVTYFPSCARTDGGMGCSFLPGETIAAAMAFGRYDTAIAAGLSHFVPHGTDHRWWEMWLSLEPGGEPIAEACFDQSEEGGTRNLNPRITFQPRFPGGCPQPDGLVYLNVTPIPVADSPIDPGCGMLVECRALVFGP